MNVEKCLNVFTFIFHVSVQFGSFFSWMVKHLVGPQIGKKINNIEPQKLNNMTNKDMKIK